MFLWGGWWKIWAIKTQKEIFACSRPSFPFKEHPLRIPRAKTNEVRRGNILATLNDEYKHLDAETKPQDGFLFGKDLEGAMRSVETTNRLSRKLGSSSSQRNRGVSNNRGNNSRVHFLGRGQGIRIGRQQPFYHQSNRYPPQGYGYHHQQAHQQCHQTREYVCTSSSTSQEQRRACRLRENLSVWKSIA